MVEKELTADEMANVPVSSGERGADPTVPARRKDPIYDLLAGHKTAIQNVLPKHLTAEKILRVAYTAIQRNPKLRRCSQASIINSILELSMLGLSLGRTGHIIPYGNEAVFVPDYKGYIDLAYRSDRIESFPFKAVYEKDVFEYAEGTTRYIKHVPTGESNRGPLVAAYAICFFKGSGFDFEVVTRPDIEGVKRQSPAARSTDSPWNKRDQEWTMWCKTAVRRLAKRIPQSEELQRAAYHEEMAEAGLTQDICYFEPPIDIEKTQAHDAQKPKAEAQGKEPQKEPKKEPEKPKEPPKDEKGKATDKGKKGAKKPATKGKAPSPPAETKEPPPEDSPPPEEKEEPSTETAAGPADWTVKEFKGQVACEKMDGNPVPLTICKSCDKHLQSRCLVVCPKDNLPASLYTCNECGDRSGCPARE